MDLSGTPDASCFSQEKATENFLRLCRLITGICSYLLRDILSHYIKPNDLRSELDKNKTKLERIMNADQKKLVYPASGGASLTAKDLDISVLYILLRNICNIPKQINVWGNPAAGDKSIAACIDRIKSRRNLILAHSTSGRVEEKEFKDHWAVLQDAIVEIEKRLTGGDLYKRGVDHLLSCDLTVQVKTARHDDKSVQAVLQTENSVSGSAVDSSEIFYNNGEAGVQFSDLFEELSENVPERKLDQLKDIIESSCNMKYLDSIYKAVSVRECLRILRRLQLFTPSDVIFVQYLLRKIGCKEQEAKCLEFAERQSALCFYEKPPKENGFTNVLFHVRGNLSKYSVKKIEKIKETVAAIVGCSPKQIPVNGFSPSTSFLLVLSIKNIYLMELSNMDQRDKDKLIELNIDYFIVDLNIVYLERSEEIKWNLCYDPTLLSRFADEELILHGEQTTILKQGVEDSIEKYSVSGPTNVAKAAESNTAQKELKDEQPKDNTKKKGERIIMIQNCSTIQIGDGSAIHTREKRKSAQSTSKSETKWNDTSSTALNSESETSWKDLSLTDESYSDTRTKMMANEDTVCKEFDTTDSDYEPVLFAYNIPSDFSHTSRNSTKSSQGVKVAEEHGEELEEPASDSFLGERNIKIQNCRMIKIGDGSAICTAQQSESETSWIDLSLTDESFSDTRTKMMSNEDTDTSKDYDTSDSDNENAPFADNIPSDFSRTSRNSTKFSQVYTGPAVPNVAKAAESNTAQKELKDEQPKKNMKIIVTNFHYGTRHIGDRSAINTGEKRNSAQKNTAKIETKWNDSSSTALNSEIMNSWKDLILTDGSYSDTRTIMIENKDIGYIELDPLDWDESAPFADNIPSDFSRTSRNSTKSSQGVKVAEEHGEELEEPESDTDSLLGPLECTVVCHEPVLQLCKNTMKRYGSIDSRYHSHFSHIYKNLYEVD